MKIYNYPILLLLVGFAFNVNCQTNYLIKYDRSNDKYEFKKIVLTKGVKKEEKLKKFPKLKEGDVVEVKVFNYNPFLYHVDINSSMVIQEVDTSAQNQNLSKVLGMITGGLNPISTFLNGIGSVSEMFQTARSAEGKGFKKNEDFIDEKAFKKFCGNVNSIDSLVNDYTSNKEDFEEHIALFYSEKLISSKEKNSLITKFESDLEGYFNPLISIDELYPSARISSSKSGISSFSLRKEVLNFESQVNEFRKQLENPDNTYSISSIKNLIELLKQAKFETNKSFEVSGENTKSFAIDEGSILTGMNYQITFYDISKINNVATRSGSSQSEEVYHVTYYYNDKFWSQSGEVVNEPCDMCPPVIRAEGLYVGQAPRYFEDFYDQSESKLPEQATGKWVFYGQDGEIDKIDMPPSIRSRTNSNETKSTNLTSIDPKLLESSVISKRNFEFPVKGGVVMNWSTGIYGIGAFSKRNSYSSTFNTNMDTITVSALEDNALKMCIGSQMVFDFTGSKSIAPSINLGAAVDLWDDKDIHFLLGAGLKFKSFPLLSITGGIAYTRVNNLNEEYILGDNSYDLFTSPDLTSKKYALGYYFGLNINF